MVTYVRSDGTLSFGNVGGIDPSVVIGKQVRVGKNRISGVVGSTAVHNLSKDEREKAPKVYMEKVPLLGTIAAGKPLLSEENLDGYVNLTEPFIHPGKSYFALRVRGTSMINAGILEGDLAVIEQCETAIDGQIVVAILDEAITLKRYYKEASRIRLQPENPDFQPIYTQDVRIAGTLSSIVRTY